MTDRRPPAALIAAACALLAALPVLAYPLARDHGVFAVIGRGILAGQVPFVDLWDFKPPAIYYAYALVIGLFGETAPAIRALDFLVMPLVLVCLYWIGRRLASQEVGAWAALLFAVFYFTESFWTLTQNDGIALLPMCAAVAFSVKAAESPRALRWALLAGACLGLAFWFKYPFLVMGAACAAAYLWGLPPGARGRWLAAAAALGAGVLAVIALGALGMAALGALDDLIVSAQVTAGYNALGWQSAAFADALRTYAGFRWSQWGALFAAAALGTLAGGRSRLGRAALVWLLTAFALMLLQARAFDYHWLPMLPPLALLGGLGCAWLTARAPATWRGAANAALAVALLAILVGTVWPVTLPYLLGREDGATFADRFVGGELVAGESVRAAEYLSARVARGDTLYIWGFRPEIYYLAELRPATRFISQFPLVAPGYPAAWPQENVDTLWAALPPYVLVAQVDYMPWVTGSQDDSNTLLQGYTELNNWLIYNYERETQIGNLFVWRRKPQPG